ncbi:MAG: MBL fold metallo-hydrolase [Patescibacteria group bacterium]
MAKKFDSLSSIIIVALIFLNFTVWVAILFNRPQEHSEIDFLDVGQGDATLVIFPGGVKILTDAGPDSKIIKSLERGGAKGKYIDLAIISHPQLDHFNGFNYLLDRYRFGAFIVNGREGEIPEWREFLAKTKALKIPIITLGASDKISYQDSRINFLAPLPEMLGSAELNDTAFVSLVETRGVKLLLTGDIGKNIEDFLVKKYRPETLHADILKVAHHGSKFSSGNVFLKAVEPKIAVISVGKNTYGHPTKDALDRLATVGAKIFRTDQGGTLKLIVNNGKLSVFH